MMDRILNNKWSIRIVALLLAAILFVSVSTNDTTRSKRIFQTRTANDSEVVTSVPVQVYYDKTNLSVTGIPDTVDVTISGPRSLVKSAKAQQDFTVYADLRNADIGNSTVTLHTRNLSNRLKASIHPKTAKVNIQERVTKKFSVGTEIGKANLAEGYSVSKVTTDPQQITVTGAKDTVDKIAYVKATLDNKKKYKADFKEEATVTAFDNKLNKLDVSVSPQRVMISGKVTKVGKTVPLELKQTGKVSDDLTVTDMTTNTVEVVVLGSDKALSSINKIEVPVDVSDITADTVKEINVPVPKGATEVETKTIEVRIKTAKKDNNATEDNENSTSGNDEKKNNNGQENSGSDNEDQNAATTKTINNIAIRTMNLDDDLKAELRSPSNGKISITLKGPKDALNKVSAGGLQVNADLSGAKADSIYSTGLTVTGIPSNISYTTSPGKAQFVIASKEDEADKAESDESSS